MQGSNFAAEPRESPMQEALNAMSSPESDSEERKGEFVSFEGSPFQLFQPFPPAGEDRKSTRLNSSHT